eukprot:TRINITY_DN3709_c3_g1_i1.p1 TRINITY_DN3709_c3_g1~~TRINITY_DN3709_c3_g1_i1.p1  ORF type:complete len:759 (-),score=201.13 TRINITY_DN3709_c3_g1_i1:108-2357(-)
MEGQPLFPIFHNIDQIPLENTLNQINEFQDFDPEIEFYRLLDVRSPAELFKGEIDSWTNDERKEFLSHVKQNDPDVRPLNGSTESSPILPKIEETSSDAEHTPIETKHDQQIPRTDRNMKTLAEAIGFSIDDHWEKDPPLKRREQSSKERQLEKHKSAERRRREGTNEQIDYMKTQLPGEREAKLTKLSVLRATSDYVAKLEQFCLRMMQENDEIKRELDSNDSTSSRKRSKIGLSPQSSGRVVMMGVFLFLMFSVPSAPNLVQQSRALLQVSSFDLFEHITPVMELIRGLIIFAICFTVMSFFEISQPMESDAFKAGVDLVKQGMHVRSLGKFPVETQKYFVESLEKFGHSPHGLVWAVMIPWEIVRQLTHLLSCGIFIEKSILKRRTSPNYGSSLVSAAAAYLKYAENLDATYLGYALHMVNISEIFAEPSDTVGLIASIHARILANRNTMVYKFFDMYLIWYLSKLKVDENSTNTQLSLSLIYFLDGNIPQWTHITNIIMKKAAALFKAEDEVFIISRGLSMLGKSRGIMRDFEKGLENETLLLLFSIKHNFSSGKSWGSLGMVFNLLQLGKLKEAGYMLEFVEQVMKTPPLTEQVLLASYRARYLYLTGHVIESAMMTRDMVRDIHESESHLWYIILAYEMLIENCFSLAQESTRETSVLFPEQEVYRKLYSEMLSFVHKAAMRSYPVLHPSALYHTANLRYLNGDIASARESWNHSIKVAENMDLQNYVQYVKKQMEIQCVSTI